MIDRTDNISPLSGILAILTLSKMISTNNIQGNANTVFSSFWFALLLYFFCSYLHYFYLLAMWQHEIITWAQVSTAQTNSVR